MKHISLQWLRSFGAGLNSGWYNTAKPHSLGGFDLTFTLNTVIIPNSAETFNIGDAGGTIFKSTENEASTIFGSTSNTAMYYDHHQFQVQIVSLLICQVGLKLQLTITYDTSRIRFN